MKFPQSSERASEYFFLFLCCSSTSLYSSFEVLVVVKASLGPSGLFLSLYMPVPDE